MRLDNFLLTTLAIGLIAGATAQSSLVFPYAKCQQEPAYYGVASAVSTPQPRTYCFTIQVKKPTICNAKDSCCAADLRKFEIDVNPECDVGGVQLSATINGQPAGVRPSIDRASNGANATVLRVTSLGLNMSTANGAVLCVRLGTNVAGAGCLTLDALCRPPGGGPRGSCNAVLFDSLFDCCPINQVSTLSPPPPLPPPCKVCINANLRPPSPDTRPFRYNAAACAAFQSFAATLVNSVAEYAGVVLRMPFAADPSLCTPLKMSVCGVFSDEASGKAMEPLLDTYLNELVASAAGGDVCRPELDGYDVFVDSDRGSPAPAPASPCLNLFGTAKCSLPPGPKPVCTCNTTQGTLPFVASARYTLRPGNGSTNQYCFKMSTLSSIIPSTCSQTDKLLKAEIGANQTLASQLRTIVLYPGTGGSTILSSSWNAPGSNTLKVTPINWSKAQAENGLICFEVRKPYTMADICDGAPCTINLFNANKACCPSYRVGAT